MQAEIEPDLQRHYAQVTRTPLGGLRLLNKKGIAFADIWLLKNTIFLLEKQIEPTFVNLIRGMLFNVERIGYILPSHQVIDYGAAQSIKDKRLSYIAEFGDETSRLHLHAVRAAILCKRYRLSPDDSVKQMIARSNYSEHLVEIHEYFNACNYSKQKIEQFVEHVQELRG